MEETEEMWAVRDADGYLCIYKEKPYKVQDGWLSTSNLFLLPNYFFPSIKWEDIEPTKIKISIIK